MPRKSDPLPINNKKLDRRIKLTDEQREEIVQLYEAGGTSQRKLAAQFGVSRRLITFILDPEKKAKNLAARAEAGGWRKYYDREKHAENTKEHRQYKKKLFDEGKIKE